MVRYIETYAEDPANEEQISENTKKEMGKEEVKR